MMDIAFDKAKIVRLARAFTPVSEMAVLMGVPEMELQMELSDPLSEVGQAYRKARAQARLEIREVNVDLAKQGDPKAAEVVTQYFLNLDED